MSDSATWRAEADRGGKRRCGFSDPGLRIKARISLLEDGFLVNWNRAGGVRRRRLCVEKYGGCEARGEKACAASRCGNVLRVVSENCFGYAGYLLV